MSRLLPSSQSWFGDSFVAHAVESLQDEVSRAVDTSAGKPRPLTTDELMRMVWIVVAIVGFMFVGLILLASRNPDQQLTPFGILRAVGLIVLVLGGGAFATKYYHIAKTERAGQREEALKQLAERGDGLRPGYHAQITGPSVGSVPWLATEIDMLVHCDLHGSYGEHSLAVLECTYVVDMTLSKLEASMGKLAAKIMSHVEHEGVQRRCLDAIVFFEPLTSVPDLFLAPREEPLHWYFEKQLRIAGAPIKLPTGSEYWLASSDADACAGVITPEVQRTLRDHAGVILQVFSGYCIVIPKTWSWMRPVDMPHQLGQLEENLKLACTLYQALNRNLPPTKPAAPKIALRHEPAFTAPAPPLEDRSSVLEPPPEPAPAPTPIVWRNWSRSIGAGIGALALGALTLALEAPHYPPEKLNFPNLLGQAAFPMMIGALVGLFIGHLIKRYTWRPLVAPGIGALLCGGLVLAVSLPDRPADQINFAFLMAYFLVYLLIPMIIGAGVGALVGRLLRR